VCAAVMLQPAKVIRSVTSSDSFNFHNKSQVENQRVVDEVFHFFEVHKRKSVMVFTDGSN